MRSLIAMSCLMVLLSAAGLGACATGPATEDFSAQDSTQVTVTRDNGQWTADYELTRDAPAWAYYRSSLTNGARLPWRTRDWQVVTPGVVLERIGDLDVLRATNGGNVPRRIRLKLTPRPDNLEADYAVLMFTDGSVAMPAGAFDIFPLQSMHAARTQDDSLNAFKAEGSNAHITWRDKAGPVLLHGRRQAEALTEDGNGYVLFGETKLTESERLVTVVDPELPAWITASIENFAPRIADYYTERLGAGQSDKPTIMLAWSGPTDGKISFSGSVFPGLIVMNFEGRQLLTSSARALEQYRWFIGHESAHFWLGQTVHTEGPEESWITEGGADLMAVRAAKALDLAYDDRAELQKEVDDCVRLAVRPIASAGQRGEHRAYYACGAVFALAAEAAQKRADGGDWFAFLKPLIEASRSDGVLTRTEWLARFTEVSRAADVSPLIEGLLTNGAADPASAIAILFDRTGVAYRMADGKIVLL